MNDTRKDLALEYDFSDLYVEAICTTEVSSATYALPEDCLDLLDIWIGTKKLVRLDLKERDELSETNIAAEYIKYVLATEQGFNDTGNAPPDYYVIKGNEIDLWPVPDATYILWLKYYAQPTDFTEDTDSDRMSNFHFDALLWGAALRGAHYLDDESKINRFTPLYGKAIQKMIAREKRRGSSDTNPRMKSYKDFSLASFKRRFRVTT